MNRSGIRHILDGRTSIGLEKNAPPFGFFRMGRAFIALEQKLRTVCSFKSRSDSVYQDERKGQRMHVWTTHDIPKAEQYAYWREVLCVAFTSLDCKKPDHVPMSSGFTSRVASTQFEDICVSHLQSHAQKVTRGVDEIRRQPSEYFFANLQLKGQCAIRQDGRELIAKAGDLYVLDTTRPYEILQDQNDWQSLCCTLPQSRLAPLLDRPPQEITGKNLNASSFLGQVAADFMQTLATYTQEFDRNGQRVLADNLCALLAAALQGYRLEHKCSPETVRQELYLAILRFIDTHLTDPGLHVSTTAAYFRMSERYLHKLFEGRDNSFTQEVLSRRLARCARSLRQKESAQPIGAIAFQWGFGDISNFCRLFKRTYGCSPSAYRANATPSLH